MIPIKDKYKRSHCITENIYTVSGRNASHILDSRLYDAKFRQVTMVAPST